MQNSNISLLSDKELYQKCQLYGGEARKWAKRFADLLPEVARRELFRKYKFYSIYEFAAKLAGMKHETVIDILRVTKKLEGMPLLLAQMETAGWGKLKVVAGIATKENEKCLRRKLQQCLWQLYLHLYKKLENKITMMSKAESIRAKMGQLQETQPQQYQSFTDSTRGAGWGLRVTDSHANANAEPHFCPPPSVSKNELKLKELQKKLSREQKAPVDLNEVVETLLDAYEAQTAESGKPAASTIAVSVQSQKSTQVQNAMTQINNKPPSHNTPTKTKKNSIKNSQVAVHVPGCTKLPKIFHHTLRFSLNPSHNPDHIVPLFKNHERLAHHGLIENEEKSPETWRLKFERGQKRAEISN